MTLSALVEEWVVWSDEQEKVVLAYRPDVFDGNTFPASCLPTIYLTRGQRDRRPGERRIGTDWYVALYLEPEVDRPAESYADRDSAVEAAVDLANRFASGEIAYRDLYQVPRAAYLDKLDEMTGRE